MEQLLGRAAQGLCAGAKEGRRYTSIVPSAMPGIGFFLNLFLFLSLLSLQRGSRCGKTSCDFCGVHDMTGLIRLLAACSLELTSRNVFCADVVEAALRNRQSTSSSTNELINAIDNLEQERAVDGAVDDAVNDAVDGAVEYEVVEFEGEYEGKGEKKADEILIETAEPQYPSLHIQVCAPFFRFCCCLVCEFSTKLHAGT